MASKTSSIDLTTPTKRHDAERMLRHLSTRIERAANARVDIAYELLHPFAQTDADALRAQDLLKEATKKLRQQVTLKPQWYVVDPKGLFRTLWDFVAILVVLVQSFMIPLWIAFYSEDSSCNYFWVHSVNPVTLPVEGALLNAAYLTFIVLSNYFFLLDVALNFITGAIDGQANLVIWDVNIIAKAYLRRWFWVDVAASVPLDCLLLKVAPTVNWYNWGKAIRLLRLSTIVRRANGSPYRFFDLISDVRFQLSFTGRRILHVVLLLFYALHWFACLLWFANRAQSFPGSPESCCNFPNNGGYPWLLGIVNSAVIVQYLWSIFNVISGMIGLGYGAFPPITWPEALIWVFAMIVTAGLFAVLNGLIVASIITGSTGRAKYKEIMDKVVEMLKSRKVPRQLSERVMGFFKFKYAERKIVGEDDVLKQLPQSMRAEVVLSLSHHLLEASPIGFYFDNDPVLLENVAVRLRRAFALQGEYIIREGYPSRYMYFIRAGYADVYSHSAHGQASDSTGPNGSMLGPTVPNNPADGAELLDTLCEGEWFGELSLLRVPDKADLPADWHLPSGTVGRLFPAPLSVVAFANCDLYALPATEFHDLIDQFPQYKQRLHRLAMRHLALLQPSQPQRQGRQSHLSQRVHRPGHHTAQHGLSAATANMSQAGSLDDGTYSQRQDGQNHDHGHDHVGGRTADAESAATPKLSRLIVNRFSTSVHAEEQVEAEERRPVDVTDEETPPSAGDGKGHREGRAVHWDLHHGSDAAADTEQQWATDRAEQEASSPPQSAFAACTQARHRLQRGDIGQPTFKCDGDLLTDALQSTAATPSSSAPEADRRPHNALGTSQFELANTSTGAVRAERAADDRAGQSNKHSLGKLSVGFGSDGGGSFQGGDIGDVADDLMAWSTSQIVPQSFTTSNRSGQQSGDRLGTKSRVHSSGALSTSSRSAAVRDAEVQAAAGAGQRGNSFVESLKESLGGALWKLKGSS